MRATTILYLLALFFITTVTGAEDSDNPRDGAGSSHLSAGGTIGIVFGLLFLLLLLGWYCQWVWGVHREWSRRTLFHPFRNMPADSSWHVQAWRNQERKERAKAEAVAAKNSPGRGGEQEGFMMNEDIEAQRRTQLNQHGGLGTPESAIVR